MPTKITRGPNPKGPKKLSPPTQICHSTASSSSQSKSSSSFLALPAEIRNQIYSYALQRNPNTVISLSPSNKTLITKGESRALTQTCHQIREECSQIYYHNNIFTLKVDPSTPLVPAIEGFLSGSGQQALRQITIDWTPAMEEQEWRDAVRSGIKALRKSEALASFGGLKEGKSMALRIQIEYLRAHTRPWFLLDCGEMQRSMKKAADRFAAEAGINPYGWAKTRIFWVGRLLYSLVDDL